MTSEFKPRTYEDKLEKQKELVKKLRLELKQVKYDKKLLQCRLDTKIKQLEKSEELREQEYRDGANWKKEKKLLMGQVTKWRIHVRDCKQRMKNLEEAMNISSDEVWKIEDYSRLRQQNKDLLAEMKRLDEVNYHLSKENTKLRKYISVYVKDGDSNGL